MLLKGLRQDPYYIPYCTLSKSLLHSISLSSHLYPFSQMMGFFWFCVTLTLFTSSAMKMSPNTTLTLKYTISIQENIFSWHLSYFMHYVQTSSSPKPKGNHNIFTNFTYKEDRQPGTRKQFLINWFCNFVYIIAHFPPKAINLVSNSLKYT